MVSPSGTTAPFASSETELILVSGRDRLELLGHMAELRAFLQTAIEIPLKDLAFTLNTQETPRAFRLAIVAYSCQDLLDKLDRAATRLNDPHCKQIREVQGLYFTEQPLGEAGKLAVLFPGEGAPYLGMIAGLAERFPEVAQVVEHCDELCRQQGDGLLSRFLDVPADKTREAR
jgi:acyl transferase domain-containing protein